MSHLKRLGMPKFWNVPRKQETFVIRPRGAHPLARSIPLQVVVRNILGLSDTAKEARAVLSQGKILVDKKPRKDPAYGLGLMDVLEVPDLKKSYRVEMGSRGLILKEAPANKKLCKIIGKTTVRGGKHQLNLHDGRNILGGTKAHNVGDTIVISLPDQKILDHLPLKKGSHVLVIKGKNQGVKGTITKVTERETLTGRATVALDVKGKKVETLKSYVVVLGGKS